MTQSQGWILIGAVLAVGCLTWNMLYEIAQSLHSLKDSDLFDVRDELKAIDSCLERLETRSYPKA
jgi:hypothetical protein